MGVHEYSLINDNCTHFATYVCTGKAVCDQVARVTSAAMRLGISTDPHTLDQMQRTIGAMTPWKVKGSGSGVIAGGGVATALLPRHRNLASSRWNPFSYLPRFASVASFHARPSLAIPGARNHHLTTWVVPGGIGLPINVQETVRQIAAHRRISE